MSFVHKRLEGTADKISGMNKVKDLIKKQEFSQNVFALAQDYSNWETDEVRVYTISPFRDPGSV